MRPRSHLFRAAITADDTGSGRPAVAPLSPARRARRLVGAALTVAALSSCAADGDSAAGATIDAPAGDAIATTVADGDTASTTGAPGSVSPTDTGSSQPASVPAALDFTAPLVGGGALDLGSFAGTTVLFWFWAPG